MAELLDQSTIHIEPAVPQPSGSSQSGSGAWNTPIAYTEDSSQRFGFDEKGATPRYIRLAKQVLRTTLGPMPVEAFLNAFMFREQIGQDGMPSPAGAFQAVATAIQQKKQNGQGLKERDLYEPLIRALNADHASRCPGFTFKDTSDHPDETHGKVGGMKPDVICYSRRHMSEAELASRNIRARADMGFAETFIEVKLEDSLCDPPPGEDRSTWSLFLGKRTASMGGSTHTNALENLGQSIAYGVEVLTRQHRSFCFSVMLSMTCARLARWDRAGAIVTESFDIITQPDYLCLFFWCFARLSDAARGYDSTVEPALEKEADLFERSVQAHLKSQLVDTGLDPKKLKTYLNIHYKQNCVTVIRAQSAVPGGNNGPLHSHRLLLSRPICAPLFLSGRCSRTYWAVDVGDGSDVTSTIIRDVWLLKDTWRISGSSAPGSQAFDEEELEGTIMQNLSSRGVRHIPPVADHWDVTVFGDVQSTVTQEYLNADWVTKGGDYRLSETQVVRRVHYRLLLKVAGFDFLHVASTDELLHGSYDAFRGLVDAFEKGNRLHRDIHPGNIILYQNPLPTGSPSGTRKGYLIDWENSSAINASASTPPFGTSMRQDYGPSQLQWQFLSYALASRRKMTHEIVDDMESILYVVIYCGLLRLRCKLAEDREGLLTVLQTLFDTSLVIGGEKKGGTGKLVEIITMELSKTIKWTSTALWQWVVGVYNLRKTAIFLSDWSTSEWNPRSLNRFWTEFFQQHPSLPRDDHSPNVWPGEVYFSRVAPRLALGMVLEGTTIAPMKRSAGSLAIQDRRETKRARLDINESEAGTSTGLTYPLSTASIAEGSEHPAKKPKPNREPLRGKNRGKTPAAGSRGK